MEFEARRERCSQQMRRVIDFLMTVAEHSGCEVDPPTFEVRGIGITYWRQGRRFCRFDPKHQANHVWALVPGGNRAALGAVGKVSDREDGPWVAIQDVHGAVRLVPEILRAYDAVKAEDWRQGASRVARLENG
jgi:hypothetical protein